MTPKAMIPADAQIVTLEKWQDEVLVDLKRRAAVGQTPESSPGYKLLLRRHDALEVALARLAQTTWQSMESAPKDGPFLVAGAKWIAVTNDGIRNDRCFTWSPPLFGERPHNRLGVGELPTHWMQLPAPPCAGETKERT